MTYKGVRFSSSEHAYQYEKCKQTGYADAAAAITKAPFPKMAKEVTVPGPPDLQQTVLKNGKHSKMY